MKRSKLSRRARLRRRTPLRSTGTIKRAWKANPELGDARKAVRARSLDRCEVDTPACPPGWHLGAHAHHVRLRAQGGPDTESNLLWVCAAAHTWIHANIDESVRRGWIRQRGAA